jgi:predicted RNA binding protein YcfA (HicA-like mRNA interferase family)
MLSIQEVWRLASRSRTLQRILSGGSDRNIRFRDLRSLLLALGFSERVRGSHHIFSRDDIDEILNVQPRDGGEAKPYQVRQVRDLIVKYELAQEIDS